MTGQRSGRSPKPSIAADDGTLALPAGVSEAEPMLARIELATLEAELAYNGPERRSGPGAGLAHLLACVLDEVDYGLLLISADGRVVHANHAARTELAASKSLQLSGWQFVGCSPADQHALDGALAAARASGRRTLLTFEAGRTGLSIVPLPAALSQHQRGHAVLVVMQRGRISEGPSVDAYARERGLSRREQQVLAALCDGLRVKEIAARLEIGEETVRSYVKHLKAKTGCASIVDLVNQVSRLPPMVDAPRGRA